MDLGDVVAGRFEIEQLVASGGMGSVFRGRDLRTGSPIAVKVLHTPGDAEEQRFEREANLLHELNHPDIVRYVAHGIDHGRGYLAMEWAEGPTLAQRLRTDGALSVRDALRLADRLAIALGVAHSHGIIHRDLKPHNVVLVGNDLKAPKLLDFGIARSLWSDAVLTQAGFPIGTPGFMAPEQVRGDSKIDERADIYSLGCLIFACLALRPPFQGQSGISVLTKTLIETAPRVRSFCDGIPAGLDDLVAQMLAKDAAERPPDTRAVSTSLVALSAGHDSSSSSSSSAANASRGAPVLTESERRFLCLILVGTGAAGPLVTTTTDETLAASGPEWAASRFGGKLEHLATGGLLVTFPERGLPFEQARRAAQTALALRETQPHAPIVLRVGAAIVGRTGTSGDVVDGAAAALATTPPGEIQVDRMTAELLEAAFVVSVRGEERVLVGEREDVESVRRVAGKATPITGRDRELRMLEDVWKSCMADGVARATLVTAPAGMGKSRVRRELIARIADHAEDSTIFLGAGDPLRVGSVFGIIGDAVRRASGIVEGEALESRRKKLESRLAHILDPQRADRIAPFLGELAGVLYPATYSEPLAAARRDPTSMSSAIRLAWSDWLEAEAKAKPVLVVIDDLHWTDQGTIDLVGDLLRRDDLPICVMAFARPEVKERFPRLWDGRDVAELRLSPLTRNASKALVHSVLDAPSDEMVAAIVEKAGGNAFYLEEILRAVHDGRANALPETVLATVQARLDALGPDLKRTLRAASVFGDTFWLGGVRSLLEVAPDVAEGWLDALVAKELVLRTKVTSSQEDPEFTFGHNLVREAAYAMLTDDDRMRAHRVAGTWLEATGHNDAHMLAGHYELGGDTRRAVRWFSLSAHQALTGFDPMGAIERAERCIAFGVSDAERWELRIVQTTASVIVNRFDEADRYGKEVFDQAPPGSVPWFSIASFLGRRILHKQGLASLPWMDRVSSQKPAPEATQAFAHFVGSVASLSLTLGYAPVARLIVSRLGALDLDPSRAEPSKATGIHWLRSAIAELDGRMVDAIDEARQAIAKATEAGEVVRATFGRIAIAQRLALLGAFAAAEVDLQEAMVFARRLGLAEPLQLGSYSLARLNLVEGRWSEAAAFAQAAVEALRRTDPRFAAEALAVLAEAAGALGDWALGEKYAREAIALAQGPLVIGAPHASLAKALVVRGQTDEAVRAARQGLHATEGAAPFFAAEGPLRLAEMEALAANGEQQAAVDAAGVAVRRIESLSTALEGSPWQATFLGISENAKILELARLWRATR